METVKKILKCSYLQMQKHPLEIHNITTLFYLFKELYVLVRRYCSVRNICYMFSTSENICFQSQYFWEQNLVSLSYFMTQQIEIQQCQVKKNAHELKTDKIIYFFNKKIFSCWNTSQQCWLGKNNQNQASLLVQNVQI